MFSEAMLKKLSKKELIKRGFNGHPSNENYLIHKSGQYVVRCKHTSETGRKLSQKIVKVLNHEHDYKKVFINQKIVYMHIAVMESYLGEIIDRKVWDVHHKDGNKSNNSIENLVKMPLHAHRSLHAKKRIEEKGKFFGADKDFAYLKLDDSVYESVRDMYLNTKKNGAEIATELNIDPSMISIILQREYGITYNRKGRNRKLHTVITPLIEEEAVNLRKEGWTYISIARKLDIGRDTVNRICKRYNA